MNMAELMDTPRLFTALAEWAACLVYIMILKKRFSGGCTAAGCAVMLALQVLLQYLAGLLPLYLWLAGLIAAMALMYLNLLLLCLLKGVCAGGVYRLSGLAGLCLVCRKIWP